MKNNLLKGIMVAAILVGATYFQSCDKIKDATATNLSFSTADVVVTVNPISDTTNQVTFGSGNIAFSLDTFISNHTSGTYHLSNIKSAKVAACHLELVNAPYPHFNNFRNIQSASVALNTNTFVVASNLSVPDIDADYLTLNVDTSKDLVPVLSSTSYTYFLSGKLRTATLDTMQVKVHLEMNIKVE